MNHRLLLLGALVPAALLGACDTSGGPPYAVVDSAGVTIVTSQRPVVDRADLEVARSLPSRVGLPQITIGVEAGTELNDVTGALRLSDGRIVVADGGNGVVRFFTSTGGAEGMVGGEGDGPAEFRILESIGRLPADTVWAYDFSHQKVVVISPLGEVARVVTLADAPASSRAVVVLPGDTTVLGEAWSSAQVAASGPGVSRGRVAYVRLAGDGEMIDTVATVLGREVLVTVEGGRGVMGNAPLGRVAVHAWSNGRVVIGDQAEHEIRLFTPAGTLVRIVRWRGGDLAVTTALARTWREARLSSVPAADRADLQRMLRDAPMPAARPAYGGVVASRDGMLWVERFRTGEGGSAAAQEDRPIWDVFDADGIWRGSVELPPRFEPLDVGESWVLGVARDAFDVQRVELRRLEHP